MTKYIFFIIIKHSCTRILGFLALFDTEYYKTMGLALKIDLMIDYTSVEFCEIGPYCNGAIFSFLDKSKNNYGHCVTFYRHSILTVYYAIY